MPRRKSIPRSDPPSAPASVDLDALDLSGLLPMTEALLRSMEDYQRHAAAAGFRVSLPAVSAWQSSSMAALAVEAELSRLGVTADLPRSSGSVERLRAVEALRQWLLGMRGKDWQGWGVQGWQPPAPLPTWELPDLARPLAQLREIVRDAREQPEEPPAVSLETTPGGIKYGKATVDLSGKPLACIRELLAAYGYRLDWEKLRDRVWGQDSYTEQATIKNTIADARAALRKLARKADKRIDNDFDPLPCVDRGKELAWKLNFPQ